MEPKHINELNDKQLENLEYLLTNTSGPHLDKIRLKYGIARGRSNSHTHQNVLDNVFTGNIPLGEFISWLGSCNLEGNNYLFIYEPTNPKVFINKPLEKLYTYLKNNIVPLYHLDREKLKTIELVDLKVCREKNQLHITFAAPSQLQIKDKKNSTTILKNDIYFAYFTVDYNLQHIVLLMHPTSNLSSIGGETKKKEWDELTWILLRKFKETIFDFDLSDPEWVVDSLFEITEEFFHHHNPQIDSKMNEIQRDIIPQIINTIKRADSSFSQEEYRLRFERSLENMFENELITNYGRIIKKLPFKVFLQESDKGITQFKTNSKGQALNSADAGEFVKLMWNNGDIVSLGITYTEVDENYLEKKHSYKVTKTNQYYSFKKINTTGTKREVVNNVLRIFDEYKQKVQSSFSEAEDIEQRTYDAENE
ncbi:hypothetical protein ACTFQ7_00090 [Bacillus cereus group sp. MYBK226-2]|uniref:hypothetical protein n=1 Tax=Bacillus cereus group sp. MYBK226-2 TaxID=3450655 RepID=UPI003F79E9F1